VRHSWIGFIGRGCQPQGRRKIPAAPAMGPLVLMTPAIKQGDIDPPILVAVLEMDFIGCVK